MPISEKDLIESQAILKFVGTIVGAYEAGFFDTPIFSIGQLYQVAINYIKDSYGIDSPSLENELGKDFACECYAKELLALIPPPCKIER
jgi:hypothetical protein